MLALLMSLNVGWTQQAKDSKKLQQVIAEINKISARLKKDQQLMSDEQKLLKKTSIELNKNNMQVDANRNEIDEIRKALLQLDKQEKSESDQLQQLNAALQTQLKAAIFAQLDSPVKSLLSTQDAQSMSRLATYHAYIAKHRQQLIGDTARALKKLKSIRTQKNIRNQMVQDTQIKLKKGVIALKLKQKEKSSLIAQIKSRTAKNSSQLKRLKLDRKRLQQLIKDLGLANYELLEGENVAFKQLKGHLPFPVKGRKIRNFGEKRQGGELWQGVLLSAQSPVTSVANGRIIYADWLRGYGMLIIIDHGQGYMSLYGQNEALYRVVGDWVQTGDKIAKAGFDPEIKDQVCYFEIRKKATAINPSKWLVSK